MEGESKISTVEWGLVIAGLFVIDGVQILLEWLLIGIILNPLIDLFVGMSFALYLQLRGQSMANPKRLAGLVGTMSLEMIPVIDELPLWGLDGIFNMVISKSDKIMSKIPGGNVIQSGRELSGDKNITQQMKDGANERFESLRGNNGPNTIEKIDRGTEKIRELRDNIQIQGDSDEW